MEKGSKTMSRGIGNTKKRLRFSATILVSLIFCLITWGSVFAGGHTCKSNICKKTAIAAFKACRKEANSDYWIERGNCYNISNLDQREECLSDARDSLKEAREECKEQFEARLEVCDALGGGPYDPRIDPADFVDPAQIGNTVAPNPYFPLVSGYKWKYQSNIGETTTDEVLGETKEILGVRCAIIHDVVETDEGITEDTYDWYAQDIYGNVWYFGEISEEFEDGDLVSIEGSWKAGVDGAKPGIIMPADPTVGDIYRQEFSLGNAEDMGEIISLGEESVDVPYGSFTDNVLKTRDFTPLEPDVNEFKYYAPRIGVVLEENPDSGERVELIEFTTP